MKFGVCLACDTSQHTLAQRVRLLDEFGFHHLWLTDLGLNASDVFVFMTLAAMHSSRIRIGAGVHPPQLRHPAVTLNALATLNEISAGRVSYGFGTGAHALVAAVGHRPLNLAAVRELVTLSRRLMAGEAVSSQTPELLMDNAKLAPVKPAPMPIYLAATGPKTLRLAAEVADGVIAHVGAAEESVSATLSSIDEGLSKRSHEEPFDFSPYLYASISQQREKAIAACARGARTVAFRAPHLAGEAGCSAEQVARLRLGEGNADDVFTDSFVDKMTLSGTAEDCIAKLEALKGLGVNHVTLYLKGDDVTQQIELFGSDVLPHFA